MNATEKITQGRLIAFICLLLLPLAAIIFGGVLPSLDVLINFSFAMTFIILPLGFAALLALIFFCRQHKTRHKGRAVSVTDRFLHLRFFCSHGVRTL